MTTTHRLDGCTSTPLAHYLKAIAVLRLVAEQKDRAARGWWENDTFCLESALDRNGLIDFLLHEYRPTPLVAPWNSLSGFYPSPHAKAIVKAFDAIRQSRAARFANYVRMIAQVQAELVGTSTEAPNKEAKSIMLARARNTWAGAALDWLLAAAVLKEDLTPAFPATFGTAGNDGKLEFTGNFLQRLVDLFDPATGQPREAMTPMASNALYGDAVAGIPRIKVGQYLPGGAGGPNGTVGFTSKDRQPVNPWDFVLMLEGAVALRVAPGRQLDSAGPIVASAPFAVRPQAAGYASGARIDEVKVNKGIELRGQGEQWLPLWGSAATWSEIRSLFGEGRMRVGARRAKSAVDAARAIAQMGVARGIGSFERFAFMQRNGTTHLAVPLGRWPVVERPRVRLLDEIDAWTDRLRVASRGKTAPASFGELVRRIESAMFAACREEAPARWQALVATLGEAEQAMVERPKATADSFLRPLPGLSPEWVEACTDGSREVRIASAIASQVAPTRRGPAPGQLSQELGPIRAHCAPLDAAKRWQQFARGEGGLISDPRVVWTGRDLVRDLAAVAARRAMESRRAGLEGFGLVGLRVAALDDVDAFLIGEVDDARIAALARGLMAVRWPARAESAGGSSSWPAILPVYALFRLLHVPRLGDAERERLEGFDPRLDPTLLRLLAAGRLSAAVTLGIRRLRASGLTPKLREAPDSSPLAVRIGAAMAIPVGVGSLEVLKRLVTKPLDDEELQRDILALQRPADDGEATAPGEAGMAS